MSSADRSRLPPGLHKYEDLAAACRRGEFDFATVRAASGRRNHLFGITPGQLALLRDAAKQHRTGLLIIGSRVSGPRSRQRDLHPALAASLPLQTRQRIASAVFPGVKDVEIDKTTIKELGPADPRTSDLSVLLVDPLRSHAEMDELAVKLERCFSRLDWSFPVRVFSHFDGRYHRDEADFAATGELYLRSLLPPAQAARFSAAELRDAMRELYFTLNLPRRLLTPADLGNGILDAILFTASFSIGLGYHPALPAIGFGFGLFGRYMARMRAAVAFRLGDGLYANACAMAFDALLGMSIMAGLIVPATGLAIGLGKIALGSTSHTLSRGALRLFIDKRFSTGRESRQSLGVCTSILINFAQGVATSFVYAGSLIALGIQTTMSVVGLVLLFGPIIQTGLAARRAATPRRAGLPAR